MKKAISKNDRKYEKAKGGKRVTRRKWPLKYINVISKKISKIKAKLWRNKFLEEKIEEILKRPEEKKVAEIVEETEISVISEAICWYEREEINMTLNVVKAGEMS